MVLDSRLYKNRIFLTIIIISISSACQSIGINKNVDDQLEVILEQSNIEFPDNLSQPPKEMVELGEALFWDPILSGNKDMSCATCHHPQFATGDGMSFSIGTGGKGLGNQRQLGEDRQLIPRNAPEIFNRGLPEWETMFWDSRIAVSYYQSFINPADNRLLPGLNSVLAVQAMFPVTSRDEMRGARGELDIFGLPNELAMINEKFPELIWEALMDRLLIIPEYVDLFSEAFPDLEQSELDFRHAANAIAAYEIAEFTFLDSPWDLYLDGDLEALSIEEKRGAVVFYGDGNCVQCHSGFLMTDQQQHNLAVPQIGPGKGSGKPFDFGRMLVTEEDSDRYSFRTPPLRNVGITGPWMHNGAFFTLEAVILHHLNPSESLNNYDLSPLPDFIAMDVHQDRSYFDEIIALLDPQLEEIQELTNNDISDLIHFLNALTSPSALNLDHLIPESVPSGLSVGGQ